MGLLDSLKSKVKTGLEKVKSVVAPKKATATSTAVRAAGAAGSVSKALPPQVRLALAGAAASVAVNQNTKNPIVRAVTTTPVSIGVTSAQRILQRAKTGTLIKPAPTVKASSNPPGSGGLIDKARALIKDNPLTAVGIAAAGGALVGAGVTAAVTRKKKSTKKAKKKSKPRKSRSRSYRKKTNARPRRRRTKRSYGTEAQYKRKGGKDVHYDKRGHPYIIKANGMHRYIKRSR